MRDLQKLLMPAAALHTTTTSAALTVHALLLLSMSKSSITLTPDAIQGAAEVGEYPDWLTTIIDYVQRAAADGEQVTLTARPQMMTPRQVAETIGVSRSTISRKIAAGELHAVKVGNRNRIPYTEFLRFWEDTMGDIIELDRDAIATDLFGE